MPAIQARLNVADTLTRVCRAIGLVPVGSPFSSSDQNIRQLTSMVTDCGQELATEHDWQFLSAEHVINTLVGVTQYALPTDLDRYVPDSQWNYSTRLPMVGSLPESEWQQLKARSLGGLTIAILFRVDDDFLELYAAPSTSQELRLPYVSRAWCTDSVGTPRDNVEADTDIILYDQTLFRKKLVLAWKAAKGFDTTAAQREYDEALSGAKAKDSPASTINIVPGGAAAPLLGNMNIPETGYGS
jgi:hypothetical protein